MLLRASQLVLLAGAVVGAAASFLNPGLAPLMQWVPEDEQEDFYRNMMAQQAKGPTDLPWLPESRSPEGAGWTNSIAVCAFVYNEAIGDIHEWLHYYQWLGVDHVYLTDNGSDNYEITKERLEGLFPRSFLTVRSHPKRPAAQMPIVSWCVEELRDKYNWVAFFDIDEFLLLRTGPGGAASRALKPFLDEFKHDGGLVVHWIIMGPSGLEVRPSGEGILWWNTQCNPTPDVRFKTIVNTWFLRGVSNHGHNFDTGPKALTVNEVHDPELPEWRSRPGHLTRDLPGPAYTKDECTKLGKLPDPPANITDYCYLKIIASTLVPTPRAERVALMHYAVKTEADFRKKIVRGSSMGGDAKDMTYFEEIRAAQRDAPVCRSLLNFSVICCADDDLDGYGEKRLPPRPDGGKPRVRAASASTDASRAVAAPEAHGAVPARTETKKVRKRGKRGKAEGAAKAAPLGGSGPARHRRGVAASAATEVGVAVSSGYGDSEVFVLLMGAFGASMAVMCGGAALYARRKRTRGW